MGDLGLFELAASQVLRALRGRRSQIALAKRLGYRSNPITDWENGRRFPTAPEVLRMASLIRCDLVRAFAGFAPAPAPERASYFAVAEWLDSLRGSTTTVEVARRSGCSRFSVGRWLSGESVPRLPDFLRLLDAITGRAADWVAALVPIDQVPSLAETHARVRAARRLSIELPWSEAVLRVMETCAYGVLLAHCDGFVAARLGISDAEVAEVVQALLHARVIVRESERYRVVGSLTVDTKAEPEATARLRRHWARVAHERLHTPHDNWFAYNVMSVSNEDVQRIEQRLRAAFREVRGIVKSSEPAERAVLLTLQLTQFELSNEGK